MLGCPRLQRLASQPSCLDCSPANGSFTERAEGINNKLTKALRYIVRGISRKCALWFFKCDVVPSLVDKDESFRYV